MIPEFLKHGIEEISEEEYKKRSKLDPEFSYESELETELEQLESEN